MGPMKLRCVLCIELISLTFEIIKLLCVYNHNSKVCTQNSYVVKYKKIKKYDQ
jgi:hypothetical protein